MQNNFVSLQNEKRKVDVWYMYNLNNSQSIGQSEKQEAQKRMNSFQNYAQGNAMMNAQSGAYINQAEKQKAQSLMNSSQMYNQNSAGLAGFSNAINAKEKQEAQKRMNPYNSGM